MAISKMILNPEWVKEQEILNKARFAKVQATLTQYVKNPEQLGKLSSQPFTKRHKKVLSSVRYIHKAKKKIEQLQSVDKPSQQKIGQVQAHMQRRITWVKKLGFELVA